MKYAQDTSVPVERSRAEIEATVMRYGATGFMTGWNGATAMIAFEIRQRRVKILLPLPDPAEKRFHLTPARSRRRSPAEARREWEQACRQRWRALALTVKAKLEAVECGIATFEQEFMAHIVMPNGQTIGESILPTLDEAMSTGTLPPLLPGPTH